MAKTKQSAGILLFRRKGKALEFFLVHPGGPFFQKKSEGWWSVPKGEPDEQEDLKSTAIREFREETGYTVTAALTALQPVIQKNGKKVYCWAGEQDIDADYIKSNSFDLEWPPHSGKIMSFPEIDKAGWFSFEDAWTFINERQRGFLEECVDLFLH